MLSSLITGCGRAIQALGCLLTLAAVGLVGVALFAMTSPAARSGRGAVVFAAMVCALFGLPILLGSRSGRRGDGSGP
jgi:hypothetical protein